MRVICLLTLVALAVTPILAFADDIDADTGATRQLLQGRGQAGIGGRAEAGGGTDNRAFSSVAQHKTPQAPRITRKNFDRKMPDGRHLLNLDTDSADMSIGTRQLLQGRGQAGIGGRAEAGGGTDNRAFSSVAQHKTPQAPRITRKNFDRKMPDGRHLLNLDTDSADMSIGTRQLLQGRGQAGIGGRAEAGGGTDNRAFSSVAAHKTPQAPRITRKNFDRKMPDGRHLLAAEMEVAGRQLLQGVRTFSSVSQHKTPKAPSLGRKDFSLKNMPKRALLELQTALANLDVAIGTRQLLQGRGQPGVGGRAEAGGGAGTRQFSSVTAHKTPQVPRLTRKNFERKMP